MDKGLEAARTKSPLVRYLHLSYIFCTSLISKDYEISHFKKKLVLEPTSE